MRWHPARELLWLLAVVTAIALSASDRRADAVVFQVWSERPEVMIVVDGRSQPPRVDLDGVEPPYHIGSQGSDLVLSRTFFGQPLVRQLVQEWRSARSLKP